MNEVRNVLIGFEFNRDFSQISYYDRKADEPVVLPTKVGTNLYRFPTAIGRKPDKDEWHFGFEAEYFGKTMGGIYLSDIYDRAMREKPDDEPLKEGELPKAWQLLAFFFRESLCLTGLRDIASGVSKIMVTTEKLDVILVENLRKALAAVGFSANQYSLQDYMESFYYYTYSQRPDFWTRNIALFTFDKGYVTYHEMREQKNLRPSPVAVWTSHPLKLPEDLAARDDAFLEYAAKHMKEDVYSGVLVTGDGFDTDWPEKTIRFLGRGKRRVFYGDNLFVKGACYAALEIAEKKAMKGRIYMSPDLLKTDVGMDMLVDGNPMFVPLLKAGKNWFEESGLCEIILDGKEDLTFVLAPMDGSSRKLVRMELPGLPTRPARTTRLRIEIYCDSPEGCRIHAEDLGFGGFFEATHKKWTKRILFPKQATS
ncbi:MAG: DUF5716 family protein [Lachnospiraceae bacterium]|nr:DUF5716 family protein [Lachnospiraceae bacterium]